MSDVENSVDMRIEELAEQSYGLLSGVLCNVSGAQLMEMRPQQVSGAVSSLSKLHISNNWQMTLCGLKTKNEPDLRR